MFTTTTSTQTYPLTSTTALTTSPAPDDLEAIDAQEKALDTLLDSADLEWQEQFCLNFPKALQEMMDKIHLLGKIELSEDLKKRLDSFCEKFLKLSDEELKVWKNPTQQEADYFYPIALVRNLAYPWNLTHVKDSLINLNYCRVAQKISNLQVEVYPWTQEIHPDTLKGFYAAIQAESPFLEQLEKAATNPKAHAVWLNFLKNDEQAKLSWCKFEVLYRGRHPEFELIRSKLTESEKETSFKEKYQLTFRQLPQTPVFEIGEITSAFCSRYSMPWDQTQTIRNQRIKQSKAVINLTNWIKGLVQFLEELAQQPTKDKTKEWLDQKRTVGYNFPLLDSFHLGTKFAFEDEGQYMRFTRLVGEDLCEQFTKKITLCTQRLKEFDLISEWKEFPEKDLPEGAAKLKGHIAFFEEFLKLSENKTKEEMTTWLKNKQLNSGGVLPIYKAQLLYDHTRHYCLQLQLHLQRKDTALRNQHRDLMIASLDKLTELGLSDTFAPNLDNYIYSVMSANDHWTLPFASIELKLL